MNIFARSAGGLLSDWAFKRWKFRGRIWALLIVQTLGGVFCIGMALVTMGKDAPHPPVPGTIPGWARLGEHFDVSKGTWVAEQWEPFVSDHPDFVAEEYLLQHCGAK